MLDVMDRGRACPLVQRLQRHEPVHRSKVAAAAPERAKPDVSPITPVLAMISGLPQGDPARQAEVFQATKDAAELTPTTSNKLRYACSPWRHLVIAGLGSTSPHSDNFGTARQA